MYNLHWMLKKTITWAPSFLRDLLGSGWMPFLFWNMYCLNKNQWQLYINCLLCCQIPAEVFSQKMWSKTWEVQTFCSRYLEAKGICFLISYEMCLHATNVSCSLSYPPILDVCWRLPWWIWLVKLDPLVKPLVSLNKPYHACIWYIYLHLPPRINWLWVNISLNGWHGVKNPLRRHYFQGGYFFPAVIGWQAPSAMVHSAEVSGIASTTRFVRNVKTAGLGVTWANVKNRWNSRWRISKPISRWWVKN